MDANLAQDLTARLDTIIKLLALGLTVGKSQKDKVRLLSSIGLTPKQVADILGTKPNVVRAVLSDLRSNGRNPAKQSQ